MDLFILQVPMDVKLQEEEKICSGREKNITCIQRKYLPSGTIFCHRHHHSIPYAGTVFGHQNQQHLRELLYASTHLTALRSPEPCHQSLHPGGLAVDHVKQKPLQLEVGQVVVEDVGEGAKRITHEVEHANVPEGLPGRPPVTLEQAPQLGEGGAPGQPVAVEETPSGVGQLAVGGRGCGRLGHQVLESGQEEAEEMKMERKI